MIDSNVHRMLVGGPRDNQIVWVQESMPEFQVCIHQYVAPTLIPTEPMAESVTVETGWYFLDDFYWGNGIHAYFRWQDWSRRLAAKIYMRRMGAETYEIFNKVEWETWGQ